jgi:alpha,alpha-trehalase
MDGNSSRAAYWEDRASKSRAAILDLHWDSEALAFREYNMSSNALSDRWSIAGYYPYWSGVFPDEVVQDTQTAQKAFSGLAYLTGQ